MEKLSSDYLNAKKALDVMKAIISEVYNFLHFEHFIKRLTSSMHNIPMYNCSY